MKKLSALHALVLTAGLCAAQVPAQPAPQGGAAVSASGGSGETSDRERLAIAVSSPDYPVTPADQYTLSYSRSNGEAASQNIQVGSDYSVDLGLFGRIDARGLMFPELKARVEALVAQGYARSYPSLSIASVGILRVRLAGAISQPRFVTAWGMSRLSEIVSEAGESGISVRAITLTRADGSSASYDLLKAARLSDETQDPRIRPGDTITLTSAANLIRLDGEVRQAGHYELLSGESISDLIQTFGGGLTSTADASRVKLEIATSDGPVTRYIDLEKQGDEPPSLDGCVSVHVPSRMEYRAFVWFVGAISAPSFTGQAAETAAAEAASLAQGAETTSGAAGAAAGGAAAAGPAAASRTWNRLAVRITDGELLSSAIQRVRDSLTPGADLMHAQILRADGSSKTINLEPLLAAPNPPDDFVLRPFDRIFIPTLVETVTVYGAVFVGGAFPYQQGSSPAYYIGLAGGIDPEQNGNGAFDLLDKDGKRIDPRTPVLPGDRIYVPRNGFAYNFQRYTPLVSGIVTMLVVLVPFVQNYLVR